MPIKITAKGFSAIPWELMRSAPDPSWPLVYAWVFLHGFGSDQGCWATIKTLSEETGVHRVGVRRALSWLVENGWLEVEVRPGFTTLYHVRMERTPTIHGPTTSNHPGHPQPDTPATSGLTPRPSTVYEQETQQQEPKNKKPNFLEEKKLKQKKDPFRLKRLPSDAVPADLLGCADLIAEFWGCKKGTRSEPVFNRICNKLKQWTPEQRQDALERAIAAGWGDVFEPRPQAAYNASQGTERKWTSEMWSALDEVNLF